MKILVVYGTNSGGTLQAGEIMAEVFKTKKHACTLVRADEVNPETFGKYGLVVFGSCSWGRMENGKWLDGQLQYHWLDLKNRLTGKKFPKTKFALYGLGDESYEKKCGAADELEKLLKELEGIKVGPTLRILGFYYDLEANEILVRNWAETILGAA